MKKDNKEQSLRIGYYLIELIRAALTETEPGPMPEGITPEELYKMAKRHNVDCIAYNGACKIQGVGIGDYKAKWNRRSMQCAMQGIVQLAERTKLYAAFSDAGIRILPLKGCLIKEMYPRQEYRQMADLDILIEQKNAAAVKKIMEDLGYESTGEFGTWNHDEYLKKPWCNVEIHRDMLPQKIQNAKKYKDIWERAYEEEPGNGIYKLTWDDFYIYMLEHFAKHFREGGSGIRSVMDIYVFLQNKKAELHPEYLENKLKELDLYEFRDIMEQIAEAWFEKGTVGVYKETEAVIIFSGAYGTRDLHYLLHMEKLRKKYHSQKLARLAYMGEMVFLEYDGMCILYPFLKRFPVLLPFCWVHRIFRTVFKKQDKIKSKLDYMKQMDEA